MNDLLERAKEIISDIVVIEDAVDAIGDSIMADVHAWLSDLASHKPPARIAELERENAKLRKALSESRIGHSSECPLRSTPHTARLRGCECDATEHNARIDAVLGGAE